MRSSKEQAQTEATAPDTASSGTLPGKARPSNQQVRLSAPRRRAARTRRERVIIWSASLTAVLAGMVVVASLLSGYFQVQNTSGALAPTSTAILGITPVPDITTRHNPPPDLTDLNRALDDYIRRMPLDDELGQMIQVQFVGPNLGDVMSIPNDWRAELN